MTEVVPEVIQHLDITPPCERKVHSDPIDAEFVAYVAMPCGCRFIMLICRPCVDDLNVFTMWACGVPHTNLGRALDWCRLESLGA